MKRVIKQVVKFHNDENGDITQTGIIMGILAVVAVGALVFIGPKIKAMFTKGGNALDQGEATGY